MILQPKQEHEKDLMLILELKDGTKIGPSHSTPDGITAIGVKIWRDDMITFIPMERVKEVVLDYGIGNKS